jgi:hypothetical protein
MDLSTALEIIAGTWLWRFWPPIGQILLRRFWPVKHVALSRLSALSNVVPVLSLTT